MKSTYIMNDDVLKLILSYLPLDKKLNLQRVSQQFNYCVNDLLQSQTGLRIGLFLSHCNNAKHSTFNGDLSRMFTKLNYHLINSKEKLEPVFKKCPNVKCLELANCHLDADSIEWIKSLFPKLECFRIESIMKAMDEIFWSRIGKCLSDSLIHLYLHCYSLDENAVIYLSQHLIKLQELSVKNYNFNFGVLFRNLGPNINKISLINCNKLNSNDIQYLYNKDIEYLTLHNFNNSGDVLYEICHKMDKVRYLSLRYYSLDQSLDCLKYLTKLESLKMHSLHAEAFLEFRQLMDNKLMLLNNLSLDTCYFTPQMLESIDQHFPNLTKLKLINCSFCCECPNQEQEANNHLNTNCSTCQDKCCKYLSKLSKLKTLGLKYSSSNLKNNVIHSLKLFKNVSNLEIDLHTYTIKLIDESMDCIIDLANNNLTKRMITIKLNAKLFQYIIQTKIIPRNLRIILLIPKVTKYNN